MSTRQASGFCFPFSLSWEASGKKGCSDKSQEGPPAEEAVEDPCERQGLLQGALSSLHIFLPVFTSFSPFFSSPFSALRPPRKATRKECPVHIKWMLLSWLFKAASGS